jgi:hypothetical protein
MLWLLGIDAPPSPKVSSIRFGFHVSAEVLGNALKAVPMSLEPCNLAGKEGGVKEFVGIRSFGHGRTPSDRVCNIAQTQGLKRE